LAKAQGLHTPSGASKGMPICAFTPHPQKEPKQRGGGERTMNALLKLVWCKEPIWAVASRFYDFHYLSRAESLRLAGWVCLPCSRCQALNFAYLALLNFH